MRRLAALAALALGCGRLQFDVVVDDAARCPALTTERVQQGELVLTATDAARSLPLPVPVEPTRTILFLSMRQNEPSPLYGATRCELTGDQTSTAIACTRPAAGTDSVDSTGEIHVRWAAVTFSTGVTVQRGTTTASGELEVGPVSPAESFVLVGGNPRTGNAWGTDEFVRAYLVDERTLSVRSISETASIGWQLVELTGARVQRGLVMFADADVQRTVTFSPIDRASTILLTSHLADTTNTPAARTTMIDARFVDDETLALQRVSAEIELFVAWEVISLPFATENHVVTLAPGVTSVIVPTTGLTGASSVALATNQALLGQATGSTTDPPPTNDLIGEAAVTLTPTDSGVLVERATSTATATIGFGVIDFSRPLCLP